MKLDLSKLTGSKTNSSAINFGQKIRNFFGSQGGKWTIVGVATVALLSGIGYNLHKKKQVLAPSTQNTAVNNTRKTNEKEKHLSAVV